VENDRVQKQQYKRDDDTCLMRHEQRNNTHRLSRSIEAYQVPRHSAGYTKHAQLVVRTVKAPWPIPNRSSGVKWKGLMVESNFRFESDARGLQKV